MAFSQKVKSALRAIVDSIACNVAQFVKNPGKDFTRDRKLGFVQLIRFFLCMESGCINHELLKYFYFLPEEAPTASAFHPASGRSNRGFNSLHTISLYDLLSKRYLDVIVQPGRFKNEFAALCRLIDRYIYGGCPIFVADRGFASYNVFAHALEKGCFFAIRASSSTVSFCSGNSCLMLRFNRPFA